MEPMGFYQAASTSHPLRETRKSVTPSSRPSRRPGRKPTTGRKRFVKVTAYVLVALMVIGLVAAAIISVLNRPADAPAPRGAADPAQSQFMEVEDHPVAGDSKMSVSGTHVPTGLISALQPEGTTPFDAHPQIRQQAQINVLSIMHGSHPDPSHPIRVALQLNEQRREGWHVLAQNVSSPFRDKAWVIRTDVNVTGGKLYFSTGILGSFVPLWIDIPKGDHNALRQLERSIISPLDRIEGDWSVRTGEPEGFTLSSSGDIGAGDYWYHYLTAQCGEKLGKCIMGAQISIQTGPEGSLTATFTEVWHEEYLPAGAPIPADAPPVSYPMPVAGTVANLVILLDDRLKLVFADGRTKTFCPKDDYRTRCGWVE